MRNYIPFGQELLKVHKRFNQEFFGSKLKTPNFSLQLNRKYALRFNAPNQIDIGSYVLNLAMYQTFDALLHQMIHSYNYKRGVVALGKNRYHKKEFLQVALLVGLVVCRHKSRGWYHTTSGDGPYFLYFDEKDIRFPSKESIENLRRIYDELDFETNIFQIAKEKFQELASPRKEFFLKYVCNCPPPHNSIRSGRRPDGEFPLHITCNDCHTTFKLFTI